VQRNEIHKKDREAKGGGLGQLWRVFAQSDKVHIAKWYVIWYDGMLWYDTTEEISIEIWLYITHTMWLK